MTLSNSATFKLTCFAVQHLTIKIWWQW